MALDHPRVSDLASAVDDVLAPLDSSLIELRRRLHATPEVSWHEEETTRAIMELLTEAGISPRRTDHGGIVADFGGPGPRVALRADLDALPVTERTGLRFASTRAGVMHACGHDIHTTALVGACLTLHRLDALGGLPIPVRAIFQPAEELRPSGARALMEDGVLDEVHRIFALHCDPKLDVGFVGSRIGAITAASEALNITLTSRGGHTSRPHITGDLVFALGQIITQVPAILNRRIDTRLGLNLTWGAVHAGIAPNAIPDVGTLTGTLRCLDIEGWRQAAAIATDAVHEVARPYGVSVQVDRPHALPPVMNDAESLSLAEAAARELLGAQSVTVTEQSMGGEDFGWYLTEVPGALLRLGTRTPGGATYDLHQGDVVFDERAVGLGARLFTLMALHAGGNTPERRTYS